MRIVLDVRTASDHFPGIGRYTYHLTRALAGCLGDGELILLHNPALPNTRYDLAGLASLPQVRVATTNARPFSLAEQLALPAELRSLAPQVTHFPYMVMPYAAPRPVVLTVYDLIPVRLAQYFKPHQRLMYRLTAWLALRTAARVMCLSAATRDGLLAAFRVDPRHVSVIPLAVDMQFKPCPTGEVTRVRARYGLPEHYILYVGINKPHKNLAALVEAYATLEDPPPLVLAGPEDPRYPDARRRVELLGLAERVLFPGVIAEEDLAAVYSGALVFAFISLYEGFGLPPLEAMACGVPVLCSDTAALREVAGEAALTVDPQNREAIAAGLERLLDDEALRAGLRAKGLLRAAEFSWNKTAQATLAVYKRAYRMG